MLLRKVEQTLHQNAGGFGGQVKLQADHEATEAIIGGYSTNSWEHLRNNFLSIAGMMFLIDLEDSRNRATGQTHPNVATRVFQLLGHLAELPLVSAQIEKNSLLVPSKEELRAFASEVTIPCFFDTIKLAQDSGSSVIARDLGNPEDFFRDLEVAKLGNRTKRMEFKTQGAKEWSKLWCCNQLLNPMLGESFQT